MLFDLRGSGRRRVVKVVYVTLALLMGGGLVLFGIGGDVSGGLVDAITERSGQRATTRRSGCRTASAPPRGPRQANPEDAAAWAAVARARFNLAGAGDNLDQETGAYTAAGQRVLPLGRRRLGAPPRGRRHARRPRRQPDGPGLRRARRRRQGGARAGGRRRGAQQSAGTYATLAQLAYQSGQTRTGDLARGQGARAHRAGHAREPPRPARGAQAAGPPTPEAGSGDAGGSGSGSGDGQGSGSGG